MINYNKNDLINECLDTYYETFRHTCDTYDYVPKRYNKAILKYIFKNMKKQFRKIDKEDRKYQREFKKFLRKQKGQPVSEDLEEHNEEFDAEKQQLILQVIKIIKAIKEQKENEVSNDSI